MKGVYLIWQNPHLWPSEYKAPLKTDSLFTKPKKYMNTLLILYSVYTRNKMFRT